jgi:filamentous hemagglutinin
MLTYGGVAAGGLGLTGRGFNAAYKYYVNRGVSSTVNALDVLQVKNTHPSTPIGNSKSRPTQRFYTRNTQELINSRAYSGHALDEMRTQGIMPSVVENAIRNSDGILSSKVLNNLIHYDSVNNISVVVDNATGRVVTTSIGRIKP